ncbi:hypothetical protein, partial [Vibrio parahaemolyticus]
PLNAALCFLRKCREFNMNKFLLAIILMVSSLIGVFATGLQFDLFGSPINLLERPATLLFYAFIFLGIFGVSFQFSA